MTMKKRRTQPLKNKRLVGLPVYNPVGIEERYSRDLLKLAREMVRETQEAVIALFRSPDAKEYFAQDASLALQAREMLNLLSAKFDRLYTRYAQILARRMVGDVDIQSKSVLNKSFKKMVGEVTLNLDDFSPAMRDILEASINENVDLIKSIPTQYLDRIKGAVNRSITSPVSGGIGNLQKEIQKYGHMTERRSKNIALDQTRKAMQTLSIERSKAAGVKKGIWIHTGGTKEPRPLHKAYNGKEFDLTVGAPIGDKGENVVPGQCVACRCTWTPYVDFDDM